MKVNNLGIFHDTEGKKYELLEKVTQVKHRPLSGSPTTSDGSIGYETVCGIPVSVKNGNFVTWDNVVLSPDE
jgi:hypothetical protein